MYTIKNQITDNHLNNKVHVLMVTGVYHPEVSGAANQCRQLIETLKMKINFTVLTTSKFIDFPEYSEIDDIDVFRIPILKMNIWEYSKFIFKLIHIFLFRRKQFKILHLHGFSKKSAFVIFLSKIFDKKVIIKMTSIGHDDPISCERRGYLINYFFTRADYFVGLSPQFGNLYKKSALPTHRYILIPNGVDINRFRPAKIGEQKILRKQLKLPSEMKLILFVGHFSRDKKPNVLFEAWEQYLIEKSPNTGIIFVGSTNPDHYEVDSDLVNYIQKLAQPYINNQIFFIEKTHEIEKFYRASDIFVLPSLREGMPNALLESMACGLPVITSKLKSITDWVIKDGHNGLLCNTDNRKEFSETILLLLRDMSFTYNCGRSARKTIIEKFTIDKVSSKYEEIYNKLIN